MRCARARTCTDALFDKRARAHAAHVPARAKRALARAAHVPAHARAYAPSLRLRSFQSCL
eukprot:8240486-Alexandrium_andersonii.AAC.1